MRKTLSDLAMHVKSVIVPETDEAYAIAPFFTDLFTDETIRRGVAAFRGFLRRLCDVLAAEGDLHDKKNKVAHAYENRSGTSVYYPFLNNVKHLLLNMAYHGALAGPAQSLAFGGAVFSPKLPVSQSMEFLRFLANCGVSVDGVDIRGKKQDLHQMESLSIAYPDDPAALLGMKVMAMAEKKFGTLVNWDIFLRCDYRTLYNGQTDAVSTLRNTIAPLPANVRDFIWRLHQRCLDQGLACEAEIKDFWILVKYSYKRKEVWGLNKSLNNGFEMSVKAANMVQYQDAIQKFPLALREVIAKGYGCGRKRPGIGHCDGGCRGLRIPLDDSVLAICDGIETWFDQELACRGKR